MDNSLRGAMGKESLEKVTALGKNMNQIEYPEILVYEGNLKEFRGKNLRQMYLLVGKTGTEEKYFKRVVYDSVKNRIYISRGLFNSPRIIIDKQDTLNLFTKGELKQLREKTIKNRVENHVIIEKNLAYREKEMQPKSTLRNCPKCGRNQVFMDKGMCWECYKDTMESIFS